MKRWGGLLASIEMENGKYNGFKKPFLWLIFGYIVALLAILRANYYYVDDVGRALVGYHGWLNWSRHVTEWLSLLVHPTPRLTDISPFPQLLAVAIMALAGLLVIYTFTGKKEIRWPLLLGALPMGLSPWFLECFSFKFDAPYMALSVLASIVPFLWWAKDEKKFYEISFLGLLVMIMTYQASAGIFIIEALFLAFLSWMRGETGKTIFCWLFRAALIYAVALLTFKAFFMRPPIDFYISIDMVPLREMPAVFISNAKAYLGTAWQDLNSVAQSLVAALATLWLLRAWKFTRRNRIFTLLLSLLFLLITSVLSYGPYLVLEEPFLFPRGLLGMGIWFSFVAISLLSMGQRKGAAKWLMLLAVWQLITGAAAYGDALAAQKQYTDFRVRLVVQDLNELHLTEDNAIQYHLSGDIGKAPVVRSVEKEYPAVKRLVAPTFSEKDIWSRFYFYFYHDLESHAESEFDSKAYAHLPLVLENQYHRIQSDGKDVLIELKESQDDRKNLWG